MTRTTIVKVQIQQAGPIDTRDLCLVYAEGKKGLIVQAVPEKARKLCMATGKAYFEAERLSRGVWKIGDPVADQAW